MMDVLKPLKPVKPHMMDVLKPDPGSDQLSKSSRPAMTLGTFSI